MGKQWTSIVQSMTNREEITIQEAVDILPLSAKTIRRYVNDAKAKHRLSARTVQGKYGKELRLYKDEIESLAQKLSNPSESSRQGGGHDQGKPLEGADQTPSISAKEVWTAYLQLQKEHRDAAGQIGYLQSKSDELKLLTSKVDNLRDEKAVTEADNTDLQKQLAAEVKLRKSLEKRAIFSRYIYVIIVVGVALLLLVISPITGSIIASLLNR